MYRRALLTGISGAVLLSPRVAFANAKSDSLRWASTPPINAIDPYYNYFREASIITGQLIWDTLMYRDPDGGGYKPLLAQSWHWVDETTLDFQLRDDVKWHDGQPLTADDAVYTINYVTDPAKKVNVQSNVNWMKAAEKTGDLTFRLHLKGPFPPAFEYLSGLVPIMPKDFYGANGAAGAGGRLVGTGPYRLTKFVPGASIDLERFEGYFPNSPKGRGFIRTINYRTLPDEATQIAELLSGGLDWIWYVPVDQAQRLKTATNLTVRAAETMRFTYLACNTRDMAVPNPMQNLKVRQAVACAVDREAIIKNIIGEGSSIVRSACFRTQFGCKQDVTQYSYDPVRAKKLLAEAGYPNGVTLELGAYRSREWTEAVASYLEEAGIKTNIVFQEYSAVHSRLIENRLHMFIGDWGSYSINDVSSVMDNFFTLSPDDMARDKEVASWVTAASRTNDAAERLSLYDKALSRIADEVYWLPLWINPTIYAHAKDLSFTPWTDENPRFFLAKWN